MTTEILDANGNVTSYGFACGYVQSCNTDNLSKQMYMEHAHYHVRSTKHNTPKLNSEFIGGRSHSFVIWETFDKLAPAKKFYNSIK